MSWVQTKALARMLQDYIDSYEKLNGPIKVPTLTNVTFTNPFDQKSEQK
jgi:cytochrome c peroxidase